jgi:hypothetical protein
MMTTRSAYKAGTYELMIKQDSEGDPGDLRITVWGVREDWAAEQGMPHSILGSIEICREEYGRPVPEELMGSRLIGDTTELRPEDLEEIYGGRLATRILLALFQATERNFWGKDMYDNVVGPERDEVFPFLERTHDTLALLMAKIYGQ